MSKINKTDKLFLSDIIIYLLLVLFTVAAEINAALGYLLVCVSINILVLISLIFLTFHKHNDYAYSFYLALTLIPLIRIISLSIPLTNVPKFLGFAVVGMPLFIAGAIVAKMLGLTGNTMGFRLAILQKQLTFGLIGLPLGFIEFLILRPSFKYNPTPKETIVWTALIILFTGLLEEFLYRGILYNVFSRMLGYKKAAYFTSILYAAMTVSGKSFLNTAYAFLLSVLFCRLFDGLKSIWGLSFAHGLINVSLYIICPQIFTLITD